MKKGLIISTSFLCVSFFWSLSTQAQQQKKPSERSFTAEINKVKQIQATRNTMVRQMQQPAEDSQNSTTDIQPANQPTPANTGNTNANPSNNKAPQSSGTKPSTGPMKQPRKPVGSKG
jgi:hypothetical protein